MAARRGSDRERPRNIHDSFFRALLDSPERAADFLHCHLPARVVRLLADEPPVLVDGTFVDESLANRQSDRLWRVRLKSGEYAYIYALTEHASTPDPDMAFRLLRYMLRIWEREKEASGAKPGRLTPIYTLVVYHGKARWNAPRSVLDMMSGDPALLAPLRGLRFRLRDLTRMRGNRLARDPKLKGGFLAFKYESRDRVAPRVAIRIEELISEESILATQARKFMLSEFNVDRAKLDAARNTKGLPPVGELAESYIREGEAKGRAQGRALILNRQLERRFGSLPAAVRKRIRSASVRELDSWADAVLDAPTLEAVFEEPPRN